jgi:hypothetical protein
MRLLPGSVCLCHADDVDAEEFRTGKVVVVVLAGGTICKAFGVLKENAETGWIAFQEGGAVGCLDIDCLGWLEGSSAGTRFWMMLTGFVERIGTHDSGPSGALEGVY